MEWHFIIIMTDKEGGSMKFDWTEGEAQYGRRNWEDIWSELRALAFEFGKSAILYCNGNIEEYYIP